MKPAPIATAALVALLAAGAPARADDDAAFERCLAALQPAALAAGVARATWALHTAGLVREPVVLERLAHQPEFRLAIWDYLAGLIDDERIADGRARLDEHRELLAAIERRHGVDAAVVVAIWGVETDYGRNLGRFPLVQALATLSCEGRRQAFFRRELLATLRIAQAGDAPTGAWLGSWAGAFGHTQFMPTTFERLAVDFDGDGRRDLVGNVADALASTAHFLRRAGWRAGEPWGFEVRLPPGFELRGTGRRERQSLAQWGQRGLRLADGTALSEAGLPPATAAGLIVPAGAEGPAFLVLRNFDALFGYNPAESYALAIAHLADRLRGGGPFARPWPTDDPGLSRAQRRELQSLLIARGHDIGAVDGLLGPRSRAAIRAEQQRLGHADDGRAGQRLLQALNER